MHIRTDASSTWQLAWWPTDVSEEEHQRAYIEAIRGFRRDTGAKLERFIDEVEQALAREFTEFERDAVEDWEAVHRLATELGFDPGDPPEVRPSISLDWGPTSRAVTLALFDFAVGQLVGELPDRYDDTPEEDVDEDETSRAVIASQSITFDPWDWRHAVYAMSDEQRQHLARAARLAESELETALAIGSDALRKVPELQRGVSLLYGRHSVRVEIDAEVTVSLEVPFRLATTEATPIKWENGDTTPVPACQQVLAFAPWASMAVGDGDRVELTLDWARSEAWDRRKSWLVRDHAAVLTR